MIDLNAPKNQSNTPPAESSGLVSKAENQGREIKIQLELQDKVPATEEASTSMPPAENIPLAAAGPKAGRLPVRVIDVNATLSNTVGGICFSKPEDWNFHVISHTWTKPVREWSIQVGKQVHLQLQGGNHMSGITTEYNRVFERGDFRKQACYDEFATFFKMLQDDGVRLVWFDALCINQTDEEEKSGEISNMGAFYGCSLGFYVLAHGFGMGFGLVTVDWEMPRWFSRVWTLQEFLLPRELTFVVELDRAAMTKLILVLVHKHAHFWCNCRKAKWPSLSRRELQEQAAKEEGISDQLSLWLRDALPVLESFLKETRRVESMSLLYSMKPAVPINNPRGNGPADCWGWMEPLDSAGIAEFWSFLQHPNSNECMQFLKHVRQVPEQSCMYFVESAGYLLLINTLHEAETYYGAAASRAARAGGDVTALCTALEITEKTRHFMNRLKSGSVMDIPSMRERWRGCRPIGRDYDRIVSENFPDRTCLQELNQRVAMYVKLVKEIAIRDCSDGHEEDRVLSVMKLLQTEGVQVVRTGRSLDEQIVELCKALLQQGEQALLVGLCASSAQPYPATGLSWAPHFCSDHYYSSMPRTDRNFGMPRLPKFMLKTKEIEVLNISEDGLLQLSCRSLGAHFLPFRTHLAKCADPRQCRACRRIIASAADNDKGKRESQFYRDSDWDSPHVYQDRASFQGEFHMRVREILDTDGDHSHWDSYWVLHIDGSGPAFAFPYLSKNLSEQYSGAAEPKVAFQVHELSPLLGSSSSEMRELLLYFPRSTLLSHYLLQTLNFKTWLLLLAFLPPPPHEEVHAPYFLFLVCIGHTQHNLHKIGFLELDVYPSSPPARPFPDHFQEQSKFTIGGWAEIPLSEFCGTASTLEL